VVFYFDEFPRLGRLSIVKEAFTTYTGLGIICWPFIQTLGDLKDVYPGSWETFLSNAHTTHYSAVNDLTTARMVSELAGKQTIYTSNESTSQSQSTNRTKGQSWGRSQSRTEGSSRSSTSGSSVGGSIQHPLFGDERKLRESWGRSWSETTGSSQSRTQGQSSSENESRSVGESTQQGQGRSETGRPLLFPDELRSLDKSEVLMFNAGMRPAWLKVPAYYEPESRFASAAFKRYLRPNPFVFPEVQPANQLEESKEASTIALQRLKLNPADVVQELIRRDDI
jgi:type IV secretory pathway TraG/TraD family ATPase VirD4